MVATSPFTMYQGATKKTVSGIDSVVINNVNAFVVDTSPTIQNSSGLDSVLCNLRFSNFVPDPVTATAAGWKINGSIETEGEGDPPWLIPVGSMFAPQQPGSVVTEFSEYPHIITVQPNIFNIDEGVPLNIFDAAGQLTAISRQQGILGNSFSVVLTVKDFFAGTADALQSFDVEIFGRYYNHV